jgi:2-keto-3-deoxy-L-rhamnonate aldolase RhmA
MRSFGPLRPDLGSQPGELEGRAGVYVMIETVPAVRAIDEICEVPHLAGIYVGPADLAISMGHELAEATSAPEMIDTLARIQATAAAAGLVCGIHAGSGKIAARMADMGYQMITLASESQALRRGATMELTEARGHAGTAGTRIGYS